MLQRAHCNAPHHQQNLLYQLFTVCPVAPTWNPFRRAGVRAGVHACLWMGAGGGGGNLGEAAGQEVAEMRRYGAPGGRHGGRLVHDLLQQVPESQAGLLFLPPCANFKMQHFNQQPIFKTVVVVFKTHEIRVLRTS